MKLFKIITFMMLMAPSFARAQGHSEAGGGDLCRNEINLQREMIYQWIKIGDASDLDFIEVQGDVKKFSEYREKMINVLSSKNVIVTCFIDPARINDPTAQEISRIDGVSYRAITLGPTKQPTSCINYEDSSGLSHIDCNYDLIVDHKQLQNPNYQLTHHEYASSAGIEKRVNTSFPDFSLSNQLIKYEEWVSVKKLGRRKQINQNGGIISSNFNKCYELMYKILESSYAVKACSTGKLKSFVFFDNPSFDELYELMYKSVDSSHAVKACSSIRLQWFGFINNPHFDQCYELMDKNMDSSYAVESCTMGKLKDF